MRVFCAVLVLSVLGGVCSWNKCDQTFCNRLRNVQPGNSKYVLRSSTLGVSSTGVVGPIENTDTSAVAQFSLTPLKNNTFRIVINDQVSRFWPLDALDGEPEAGTFDNFQVVNDTVEVTVGDNRALIYITNSADVPWKVEFYKAGALTSVVNGRGLLAVEAQEPNVAIALDVSFPGAQRAYGIPEHAEHLSLRTTQPGGWDPFRFSNIDYYAYAVESPESIYGTVPVLYAHSTARTSGVFWLNAAQTWIEITNSETQVESYFMSESGVLDLFVFMGPTLKESVQQYVKLTGTAPLPQYFVLGYHQSRYTYDNQTDAMTVSAEFDNHNMALDVVWLDIDHTDSKKYFTWNPENYSDPLAMQANLSAVNRKMVAISDPHIKVEPGYFVYDEALANDYFISNADGSVYQGDCWPGLSSYLDYLNPEVRDYYSSLYSFAKFRGSTENLYIWNDMNEPAVFNSPENTIPPNAKQFGGWLFRDVHNMYGFYQTMATYKGLIDRSNNLKRPFVLTRSHFAGSQRHTGMWTGDNAATWEYLRISIPMCLTEALAGISMCGADVGGFEGFPDEELFIRWYQLGAWYTFYRAHSAISTPRREPYLYPEDFQERVRVSLRQRYAHIPTWYTLWWEHTRTGEPVIRPLSYHYASDANVLDIDTQFLVGSDIMVSPVVQPGATTLQIYLPGGASQIWFETQTETFNSGNATLSLPVTLDSVPVFYRAGAIIARKDTPRPTTVDTYNDTYTLYIVVDGNGQARGTLYVDDYVTFDYRNKEYNYMEIVYTEANGVVINKIDADANYDGAADIDIFVIIKPPSNVKGAQLVTKEGPAKELTVKYNENKTKLTISNVSAKSNEYSQIKLLK